MDEAIIEYIRRKHGVLIGSSTAETIKMTIGNAFPGGELEDFEVKGEMWRRYPKLLTMCSDEAREAISEQSE